MSKTSVNKRQGQRAPVSAKPVPSRPSLSVPSTSKAPAKPHVGFRKTSTSRAPMGRSTKVSGKVKDDGKPDPKALQKKREEVMRPSDALNTEFIYYNSCLKLHLPGLSDPEARGLIAPWLQKLNSPLYGTPSLKDKRNRFLHSMLITVLNDEAFGWFRQPPPRAALPEPSAMPVYSPPQCAWQADTSWQDIVASMPTNLHRRGCVCGGECPDVHNNVTEQLDDEFRLILHLLRPYVELFPDLNDQMKISQWIQVLCCITKEACIMMKGIRNDYMTALFGCAHNLQLSGLFEEFPDFDKRLPDLGEATEELPQKPDFMDPSGTETEDFMKDLPIPEEGAFCYIALTGDLISSE